MSPRAGDAVKVEVLERTDDYTIASWERMVFLVWASRATGSGIDRVHAVLQDFAPRHPAGVALLNVVPPQPTRPPDELTRAALERASRNPVPGVKGIGTLYEGSGFIAASVRSVVARVQFVRTGERLHFFGKPEEAAAWAATLLAAEITGDTLAEAIRQVREG